MALCSRGGCQARGEAGGEAGKGRRQEQLLIPSHQCCHEASPREEGQDDAMMISAACPSGQSLGEGHGLLG